jgi:putative nucleotidyltransferase with HDIG domain
MPEQFTISVDQLRIGLYVYIDVKWFEHPFAFNNFKIKSEDQITTIRGLGLQSVRYDPERSDVRPPAKVVGPAEPRQTPAAFIESRPKPTAPSEAPPQPAAAAEPQSQQAAPAGPPQKPAAPPDPQPQPAAPDASQPKPAVPVESQKPAAPSEPRQQLPPALQAKRELIERIKQQREATARIEGAFVDTAATIRDINSNLFTRPAETVGQATRLVGQIAESILTAPELAVYLMGDKVGGEEMYFHSLNVTMLSLMIARDIHLPAQVVNVLGIGALFHDIGRTDIPDRILLKTDPWTKAERDLYELHCQYGVQIAKRLQLAPGAIAIVQDHHELFDGSGYPRHLSGEAAGLLARIIAMVNYYDNLCNPTDFASALTPHEALSQMFAKLRGKFDPKLLQVLVRCLGVYPPGTIVQLSNGILGMVATINAARPMKPTIVIYDADVPKEEAILVDMDSETEVNIAKAIRPAQLPPQVYNYLSPRKHVSYYFDARHPDKATQK